MIVMEVERQCRQHVLPSSSSEIRIQTEYPERILCLYHNVSTLERALRGQLLTSSLAHSSGELLAAIVLPPVSETFGRKRPMTLCSLMMCISLGITTIPRLPGVYIGRLLTGFLGMVTSCVSPGALEDIYTPEQRVWGLFIYGLASNTGMVVGQAICLKNYPGTRVPQRTDIAR